ncbi:MAG: hypothetical protein L3J19_00585 [Sulfurimonas sp.]|nr:hypothetical protein [Sulfurimonas sp.]
MKYVFIIVAILLFSTGCTKKEIKTNFHNIKDGTEKRWDSVKDDFSKETQEYKDR